ncbi:Chitinase A1 precursor [Anatilimnocola aggregata]|uniref:chitinase n=1 Tax=Anatilimnocola aggregata TaxID=2528021 RepID=A0A517Y8M6_9BACT|nr:glycoside hydrolase family 18 protein [Anatilimnocola aggregata]QDU26492.1 Chitinase A1 precursor [Anatilimnocola aggregata]
MKPGLVLSFTACLLLVLPALQAQDVPRVQPAGFRVAAYLPEYRLAEFEPRLARYLTDLIVFSAEPTEFGGINRSRLAKVPWDELRQWKTKERVRLILCIGGWERSKHFATVATSPEKRQVFVKEAVRLCLEERLDGIDLDWEHPRDEAEQEGYGRLLTELRAGFQPHGLLLSVTIAAWQKMPPEAFTAAHWVQVMAYDHDDKHSTFEGAVADVKTLKEAGVPAEKIVLGMPFYGRDILRRNRSLAYREIVARHDPKPDVDEIDGVYFNGLSMIRRKTEYALESRLGGVMAWELGQDVPTDRSLLRAIDAAVQQARLQ